MFTALTLLGLATAAALALWLLSRQKKPVPDSSPEVTPPQPQQSPSPREEERIRHEARKSELIDAIASRIKFSTAPVVLRQVKVGEREVPSPYPADSINVRPLHNVTDMRRMLGIYQAVDDDVFYGQLAGGQVLVTEDIARVDVIDDVIGVPVNMLVVLQDVSGSMEEHGRIGWAITLNQKLVTRARAGKAVFWLQCFNDNLRSWKRASTSQELEKLTKKLVEYLSVGGGTDLNKALRSAFRAMEGDDITCRKLVLITDGTQDVDTSFAKKRLRELEIELHIVCIGQDNRSLRSIADHYDLFPD